MPRKTKLAGIGTILLGTVIGVIILLSMKGVSFHWKGIETMERKNIIIQHKVNNCGPVALKMIFDHYNIPSTLNEIESAVQLNERGTSMRSLQEMSEKKGLHAEGWRLTLTDLVRSAFPVILFVNGDHYIVADSIKSDSVYIRDPIGGKLKIHVSRLSERWNGETLVFRN